MNAIAQLATFAPERLMRQCGFIGRGSTFYYWMIKLSVGLGLVVLLQFKLGLSLSNTLGLFAIGFFAFDIFLLVGRRRRNRSIDTMLGYFLDQILALQGGGVSLADSLAIVSRYGLPRSHPLAIEARLAATQLAVDADPFRVFRTLADRTGSSGLDQLAIGVGVCQQSGTPVIEALRGFVEAKRSAGSRRFARNVSRRSLQALLAVLLMSLPMVAVLVLFPLVVEFFQTLENLFAAIGP